MYVLMSKVELMVKIFNIVNTCTADYQNCKLRQLCYKFLQTLVFPVEFISHINKNQYNFQIITNSSKIFEQLDCLT